MAINLSNPEEAVRMLREGSVDGPPGTTDAIIKALLEDGRPILLRLNDNGTRFTNLEEETERFRDVLSPFDPSWLQASWAVKAAFTLRPYWRASAKSAASSSRKPSHKK